MRLRPDDERGWAVHQSKSDRHKEVEITKVLPYFDSDVIETRTAIVHARYKVNVLDLELELA